MKSFYEMLKIVEVDTVATTGTSQTTTPNQQQTTNTAQKAADTTTQQATNTTQQAINTQTANQQQKSKPKLSPQQQQAFMNKMKELLAKFGFNL